MPAPASQQLLSDWLPDGEDRLHAHHALMLRALAHEDGAWWTAPASRGVREAIVAIARRPLPEVLGATPFFWFDLGRICMKLAYDEQPTPAELAWLHVVAFDAFPELVGEAVVSGWEDGPVVLPRCGVELPATGSEVHLTSRSLAGRQHVLVDSPAGGRVLASRSRALFDDQARADIDENADLHAFAGQVAGAHALIERLHPALLLRLGAKVGWYVPLRSPDARTHRSFTLESQSGVMFLSPTDDRVRLAEAMVHELGHTELGHTVRGRPLLRESHALALGDEFYSPWRPDPRPLMGLLHGLYVFCEVASFLEGALATPELGAQHEWIAQRRTLTLLRLALGLAQVPAEALTDFGHALVDQLARYVSRYAHELHDAAPELRATIADHWTRWRESNPGLRVVVPSLDPIAEDLLR
jgi:HEXXH motif-containing protein